ncbi:glycosyltransferase [Ancylomarina longa]|uniref:Glycosyltransferase n=1 Tax=Ancylomarina longa TaxID=2487017 RepID=A0A434AVH3_9BACT|nr:glycosyltransferase [Ancylomarina longa]RUT78468.1 glycosyltransferase [Ancylomarina longa]
MSFTLIQIVFLIALCTSFAIQLLFQIFHLLRFKKIIRKEGTATFEPVSIIICSKNNALELKDNLTSFLNQSYPDFEVIVVDNGCTDNTEEVVKLLQAQYSNLRLTKIPIDEKFRHNKKLAQTIGIKAARNNKLLFSNPNCKPTNDLWLKNMMKSWTKGVLLTYSNFENKKGFWFNMIKYHLLEQQLLFASFASIKKAFAGDGNNMGYLKSDFFINKGFAKHSYFEAGYDHLMIYQLAKRSGISISLSPSTKMISHSKSPYKVWCKKNANYYKSLSSVSKKIKYLIYAENTNKIILLSLLVYMCMSTQFYIFIGLIILITLAIHIYKYKIVTRHLREENLFLSSYVYGVFMPFIRLYLFFKNLIFSI